MPATAQPNLLLISTDQQRFDTIRPFAPDFLQVPHLEFLQDQGVTFERAYAETPICVPMRANLLSGTSGFEHGLTYNGPTTDVLDRSTTLPARLRRAGYGTAAIGKMHFNPQRARHGFDETIIPEDYYRWMRESGSLHQPMRHGVGQNELYPALSTVPAELSLTSWIAEESVRYIRDRRDPTAPFFLWTSFSKPHPPLDPPEPYASMYNSMTPPTPLHSAWSISPDAPEAFQRQRDRGAFDRMPEAALEQARRAYLGIITHIDHVIGRILAALQDTDLLKSTTIIFTSDHGEFLGDHATGNKVMWHEGSARVPLIVRPAPALDREWLAATSCSSLVSHVDITRTLLDQAGAETDATEGENLLDVAKDDTTDRVHLFGTAAERPGGHGEPTLLHLAVHDGRWKYIWYPEGPAEQLFDLVEDPDELINRANCPDAADIRAQLHEELRAYTKQRASQWLDGDKLPRIPARGDSRAHRRLTWWPGYHTEFHDQDVRH